MATETLEEKTPEVKSPAKEEIGSGDAPMEKEEASSPIDESKAGEDDPKSEDEKEEELEEGSGSKNSSEKEAVTPTSGRPTREKKKVERFSLSTPMRAAPSKSVSIEKGRGTPLREIPNEEKTPEVKSPAKEEIGSGDAPMEKEEASSPIDESKAGEDDPKSEDEKEEELEEGSGSKNSSEKEAVTPTSNRPTREKKKVERFSLSTPMRAAPSKSVSIEKGRGTPLREIPNVAYQLSKRKADDNLILLHTILYGKKAKAQMVKKNIGQFSGFVWSEKEEEKQRARAKEKLDKCIKEKLIFFCDVLDIPISRSNIKKEEVAVKVLEFLESPKASRDVILADREKQAKKRKSAQKKRKSGESSDTPAKRKRQTKKRDHPSEKEEGNDEEDSDSEGTKDTHEEDDAAPEEDSDHEKSETEDEKDEAEDEKPSDKKTSLKKIEEESSGTKDKEKQASAKGSKKSGEKSSKRVAKSTSSPPKRQKIDHEESIKPEAKGSKEKGKANKKGKAEPTVEEMFEVVTKFLKEVDFKTATCSDVLRKLSDHFGVDLSHRKPDVRAVITDVINEMTDDEDEEEESEAGSDNEKEEEVKADEEKLKD